MDEIKHPYGFTHQEWETCLKVLEILKENPLANPDNQRFGALITKIHKAAKKQLKQPYRDERKEKDMETLNNTIIVQNARSNTSLFDDQPSDSNSQLTRLHTPRNCYSCNQPYEWMHSFYHRLCPSCAQSHYQRRFSTVDLKNRKVILTGGRVKIGYATALKLLRNEAEVIITTRFPVLALQQFRQQPDYAEWKERIHVYGLDLRNLKAVQDFIDYYEQQHHHLDILINNAAQTIRYEAPYYAPLIQQEQKLLSQYENLPSLRKNQTPILDQGRTLLQSYDPSSLLFNRFGQPVDPREQNSWNSTLSEIPMHEVLEVNLINHIAPYMLIKAFTPLMKASAFAEKFIINVTSSEGQFSYGNKTIFHPHTNMTKAALNMLTRTSAAEYAQEGIFMNSVDVGWVSTGAIETLRIKQFESGQIPPLDSVDGAARILHPIEEALHNQHFLFGHLLKNYKIVDW
ncbi:MAG TPA: oxidoreductase [Microscillaceae bacterium]|nr:oxidoreductase [Microscillaceae bacterium]